MPEPRPIRVLLVDDHQFFRAGVRSVLIEHGLDVVGEVDNGEEVVSLVSRRRPDVVLMDLHMPGVSGVEATRRLVEDGADVQVLVLTVSESATDVVGALEAGAAGYLLKDAKPAEVISAIEAAHAGDMALSPRIARDLVGRWRRQAGRMDSAKPMTGELSPREIAVLRLLAEGLDNSQIAEELSLSASTVKHHVSSVLAKLGVRNRVQAALQATRLNLL